jgi:hypothetical protein
MKRRTTGTRAMLLMLGGGAAHRHSRTPLRLSRSSEDVPIFEGTADRLSSPSNATIEPGTKL